MGLTRTLRKHTKKLLAVFGVLLMIAFLLPASIRSLGRANLADQEIGKIFDARDLTHRELSAVMNQTRILDRMAGGLDPQGLGRIFSWRMLVARSDHALMDYLLLIEEARHMGVEVPDQHVDRMLQEWKVPAALMNRMLQQENLSMKMIRRAVGNLLSVHEAFALAAGVVKVSEPQARHFFASTRNILSVDILPLYARTFLKTIPEPKPEQSIVKSIDILTGWRSNI